MTPKPYPFFDPQLAVPRRTPLPTSVALSSAVVFVGWCLLVPIRMHASELVMADINLGIESLPTAFDFTIQDGNSTRTGSSEFDRGFGFNSRAAYAFSAPGSRGAFFIGGAIALGAYQFESEGTYYNGVARVITGYAYAWNDEWAIEFSPYVGYGYGSLHIPGLDISADHDVDGTLMDYGAYLGVTYSLSRAWLIGARVGWQVSEADLSGEGLKVEITQSGPTAFLGVIYRFGGTPPPIR